MQNINHFVPYDCTEVLRACGVFIYLDYICLESYFLSMFFMIAFSTNQNQTLFSDFIDNILPSLSSFMLCLCLLSEICLPLIIVTPSVRTTGLKPSQLN